MKKIIASALSVAFAVSLVCAQLPFNETANATAGGQTGGEPTAVGSQKGIVDVTDQIKNFHYNGNDIFSANDYAQYAASRNTERRIIVELEGSALIDKYNASGKVSKFDTVSDYAASQEGVRYSRSLKTSQKAFLSRLDKNKIDYDLRYQYTGIVNGVALTVADADLSAIAATDGVKNIVFSETYYEPQGDAVLNSVNAYNTGIYDTTGVSYTGAGMVVAVLDTGLDYTHAAFKNMPAVQTLTKSKVAAALESGELTASGLKNNLTTGDLYKNAKVPYQFDYADDDADVFPVTSSHGTHVAGIIAGREDVVTYEPLASDNNMHFNENADGTKSFKGVATEAQLAIFKVFSDMGEQGAQTEDMVAALNDAVLLGVDVINMSLGSNAGYSRSTDDASVNEIYDKIREAGISLIVAAGNSYSSSFGGTYGNTNLATNPDSGTVGSPSTYNGALSVASISGQLSQYFLVNGSVAAYFHNGRNSAGKDYEFVNLLLNGQSRRELKYIVIGGYGEDHNYTSSIREKLKSGDYIAVVKRGTTSFEDKQKVAASYGAVGCIIYNNVSGVINASLGTGYKIPTCTITADIASQFVGQLEGTIELSTDYKAGPFMSDFSSWGATPDLQLYPDITAHGGDITSAVLGGYGVYSGTSMATPNIAGITTLIRQHLVESYPDLDKVQINELLYRLMMSTATIAKNEDGDPYSPRKQGAGLADILNTLNTKAYLYVEGSNKTKIELGDDPKRTGLYALRFRIANLTAEERAYDLSGMVMSEKMSVDGITVAERAYMFDDAEVTLVGAGEGVARKGNRITLAPNADAELTVQLRLTDADKRYLNEHFANGMYVEGYLKLADVSASGNVDLNIPFMGFYGSWLDAPLFDFSSYDVSQSKFDDSVAEEDKLQSDVYETVVIGRYARSLESYMAMGQYVYRTASGESNIESSVDKIAVGNSDYGIYEIYGVYAGLLRGAKSMEIVVSDAVTGEVVFRRTNYEVRKSVTGSPGPVYIEISPYDLNLKNNVKYNVTLNGAIDYENGEQVSRNTWGFTFTVDYEIPYVADYDVRVVYDTKKNKTVYLDLYAYDNHYVQAIQLFSMVNSTTVDYLTDYPIPVVSSLGGTAKVSIDITKIYENFLRGSGPDAHKIGVMITDYALNSGGYLLPIKWSELEELSLVDENGNELNSYSDGLQMTAGKPLNFEISVLPEKGDFEAVTYAYSKSGIVEIRDGVIFAKKAGATLVTVTAKNAGAELRPYTFTVVVTDDGQKYEYPVRTLNFASYRTEKGSEVKIANNRVTLACGLKTQLSLNFNPWYATNTGDVVWTSLTPNILTVTDKGVMTTLNPGTGRVRVSWKYNGVNFDSSLTVSVGDKYTILSGYLYRYEGADTVLEIPANLGALYLSHYSKNTSGPFYGDTNVKVAIVPDGVTSVGTAAFTNCTNLETVYLPSTLQGIGYQAFSGCKKLKNIYWYTDAYFNADFNCYTFVENGTVKKCFDEDGNYVGGFTFANGSKTPDTACTAKNIYISQRAFNGCSALQAFDLSKTTALYDYAFASCSSLKEADITQVKYAAGRVFSDCTSLTLVKTSRDTVIGSAMFLNCNALTTVDLYSANIGGMAFYRCKALQTVNIFEDTAIGSNAFEYCSSLSSVNFRNNAKCLRIGTRAFGDCTRLSEMTLNGLTEIGASAFLNCTALESIAFGSGSTLETVGGTPFSGCTALTTFTVSRTNRSLAVKEFIQNGKTYCLLYNRDYSRLIFAPESYAVSYDFTDGNGNVVSEIGSSAYANITAETGTLVIPEGVKSIGDYAFYRNGFSVVVLPASLEYIGISAFSYCENLTRVVFLGNNLKIIENFAFYNDKALEEVALPDGVESLGTSTFRFCTSLKSIVLPASLVSLGNYVFANDSNLNEVVFERGSQLTEIGKYCFSETAVSGIVLPSNLKKLGESAFSYCYNLTEITIPGSLEVWDAFAFAFCRGLKTVTIEEGVEYIGAYAFAFVAPNTTSVYYNRVLETVNMPSSVRAIYPFAFIACSALTDISFENVEYVFNGAFRVCSFTELVLPAATFVAADAFRGMPLLERVDMPCVEVVDSYAFAECEALEEVSMPNVEQLGNYVFNNDKVLSKVSMPNVRSMYSMVFYNCAALTEIDLPNIEVMGEGVFFGAGLTTAHLPASLTQMGVGTFMGCLNLAEITVDAENPVFFSDGVAVYKRLEGGGYEAYCYPAGRSGESYSILEGTVRVADYAFAYAVHVSDMEIPASVKRIGAMAFYYLGMQRTSIVYTFRSIEAPVLEGYFSKNGSTPVYMYNNFTYKFGYVQTDIRYPSNGKGYAAFVYSNYFKINEILPESPDSVTVLVTDKIGALTETATKEEIAAIRTMIDGMSETQRKLIGNYYEFLELERKVNLNAGETPTVPVNPADRAGSAFPHWATALISVAGTLVAVTAAYFAVKAVRKGGKEQ